MNRKQLLKDANQLEASTKASLTAWVICGETSKYDERMQEIANLRRAADMRPAERREFLRNSGMAS